MALLGSLLVIAVNENECDVVTDRFPVEVVDNYRPTVTLRFEFSLNQRGSRKDCLARTG